MTNDKPKKDWRTIKRKRTKQLNIRLTPEEYQQIAEDADSLGISVGAYVRKVLIDAPVPRQSKRPSVETQELANLLGHIGKVGNNLNQIARAANMNIPYERRALQEELKALKEIRQDIKKALGKKWL